MVRFEIRQSGKLQLISHSGLARVGAAVDAKIPISRGLPTSVRCQERLWSHKTVPKRPFLEAGRRPVENPENRWPRLQLDAGHPD
jgi:hypothetical protein